MTGTIFFQALALLCAAASVVFATSSARGRREPAMILGFAAMAFVTWRHLPEASSLASAIAVTAALALSRSRASLLVAASAGASAAIWLALLRLEGVPLVVAVPLALTPAAGSAWLVDRRPSFAPPALRDEARLLVLCGALILAAAPQIADGWQSALALNLAAQPAAQSIPTWVWLGGMGSAALGGVYRLWVRR